MVTTILFLIKFGIYSLLSLFVFAVLFALLGTLIHYLYVLKIYAIGNQFLRLALARRFEDIYDMLNKDYKLTTSLAEVVLLSETLYSSVPPNEKVVWHRTHIKKRKGFAVIHGTIYGHGKKRFYLMLSTKRSRNLRWYITGISLKRDFSQAILRSD